MEGLLDIEGVSTLDSWEAEFPDCHVRFNIVQHVDGLEYCGVWQESECSSIETYPYENIRPDREQVEEACLHCKKYAVT